MKVNAQKAHNTFQLLESLIKIDNKMIIKSFSFKTSLQVSITGALAV